jgi:hypothetical protein
MNSTVLITLSDDSAQNVSGGSTSTRNRNTTTRVHKTFDSKVDVVGQASDADAYAFATGPNSLAEVYTSATTTSSGSEAISTSVAASARPRRRH